MTYIRLDYAISFFITFVIISMITDFYKDYKFKLKPSDYDSGYKQALSDIAKHWNKTNKKLSAKDFLDEFKKYLQSKVEEWDVNIP